MEEEDYEVIDDFELEEDEDTSKFKKVMLSDDSDDDEETFEILLRNAKSQTTTSKQQLTESTTENQTSDLIENSDIFVRAILSQMRLHETLNTFQAEWYRLESTGSLDKSQITKVPIMYLDYYYLDQKLRKLQSDVQHMKDAATKVQKTWAKLKTSRNGYKLAHMRVGHEKHRTLEAIRSYLHQTNQKMPTLDDYNSKIETADKDRMLLELEVQRLRQLHERLLASQPKPKTPKASSRQESKMSDPNEKPTVNIKAILPGNAALNPYEHASRPDIEHLTHRVVHHAHDSPIGAVAIHPKRRVYATGGDDGVWHLWNSDNSELLISGSGHSNWISHLSFHPRGAHLATTSADGSTRIWDFLSSKCALVLQGHLDVVWGCDFHFGGRLITTCGSDSTLRIYDLQGGQEISILRGHERDINDIKWIPYSNVMVTAGADHLVGLWDARESAMVNRGIGHEATVFAVAPALDGKTVTSVDAKGRIKIWDMRKMAPVCEMDYGRQLNDCAVDATGEFIFVAADDGKAEVLMKEDSGASWVMSSFDQPCEAIAVNNECDMVVCSAADGSVAVCTKN
ncbi:sperm-associated antigen 16 protein [Histomonas meleagridis]|uniref:sperm-associated antigen 16 protein n=1 Tax=Histomonas meleagridis TaxID=135588 RepID=UPI003559B7C6|nr:sperm-associated antigen 16 protein [Histomonas meleagridis]KAH0805513.1 sperm-associated antigen 16 protein [Histomonas meleagridis]